MKNKILFLFIALVFTSLANAQTVNEKIVKYCKMQMGKKVDRGECWDLIAFALNDAGAKWNNYDVYGKIYDYKKEKIKAGDVIEFQDVKFTNPNGSWFSMFEHYAIVYEVKENNVIVIAHQNHNNVRKVQTLEIYLDHLEKGKLIFYRPEE